MASLVSPLASGIAGAASGTAEFYRQGTATLATVYSDAEGVTPVTSHTLDSNGGIVRYVEERVDVVVKDINTATVRTFTWGTDARDSRVENAGFTGTNAAGSTVAGGRTTVDAVFTKLYTSLGAVDGYVNVNGTAQTLATAISSSAGLVYNVKTGYGAVGNGVANDSGAIQAALNAAANAGGGIIYFPHGTYYLGADIVVPANVGKFTYLGESASATILQPAAEVTPLALGNGNQNLLMGLRFTPVNASQVGALVSVGTSARATFIGCMFDAVNDKTIDLASASTSRANLIACTIAQAGASSRIAGGNGAYLRLDGCDVSTSGADLTSFSDSVFVISVGTNWALGSAIAAGTTYIYNNSSGLFHVIGGEITSSFTSGTVRVLNQGALSISSCIVGTAGATLTLTGATNSNLYEAGCSFNGTGSASTSWPETPITLGNPVDGYSAARQRSYIVTTSAVATSYTPNPDYLVHAVATTVGAVAAFTFNNPTATTPTGWPLIITWKNTSGTNITPTFGDAYSTTTAFAQINSGNTGVYYFLPRSPTLVGAAGAIGDYINIAPQAAGGYTL